jgi:beta-glucanase (GH16 family)
MDRIRASRMAWGMALLCGIAASAPAMASAEEAASPAPHWSFGPEPVWQDEFDYSGPPDPAKWGYDIGGKGWGNNELQHYTDQLANAFVEDGVLTIVARRFKRAGKTSYTSARLVSRGKGDFQYGRIEFRARLPVGRGTWGALWMLPTENRYGRWPRSGEIDIMEHVGHDPGNVHVTVHTQAYNHTIKTQRGSQTPVQGASTRFHLYRVDWTPDWIRGYIDDAPVFEFANEGTGPDAWPFDQPFHLLMNLAIGGNWGGAQGVDEAVFPAWMEVDYVRVYPLLER